jgi:hypothetical protein
VTLTLSAVTERQWSRRLKLRQASVRSLLLDFCGPLRKCVVSLVPVHVDDVVDTTPDSQAEGCQVRVVTEFLPVLDHPLGTRTTTR